MPGHFPALPPGLRIDLRGSCVPSAIACLDQLDPDSDMIVEGIVHFGSRGRNDHTWMTCGGRIFDPSLFQFRRFRNFGAGPEYCPVKVIPVLRYRVLAATVQDTFWQHRLRHFGVPQGIIERLRRRVGSTRS